MDWYHVEANYFFMAHALYCFCHREFFEEQLLRVVVLVNTGTVFPASPDCLSLSRSIARDWRWFCSALLAAATHYFWSRLYHVIFVSDILYFQSDGDYVQIITSHNKYLKEETMKYFEANLPTARFVRVHRSYIVNVEKILRIETYE